MDTETEADCEAVQDLEVEPEPEHVSLPLLLIEEEGLGEVDLLEVWDLVRLSLTVPLCEPDSDLVALSDGGEWLLVAE